MTALAFLQAGGGLVLLFVGGEVLLRGAVGLSLRFGLSPLIIGLTVVAMATSMPELVVTLTAGVQGLPDIGVGNFLRPNLANILPNPRLAAPPCPTDTACRRLQGRVQRAGEGTPLPRVEVLVLPSPDGARPGPVKGTRPVSPDWSALAVTYRGGRRHLPAAGVARPLFGPPSPRALRSSPGRRGLE